MDNKWIPVAIVVYLFIGSFIAGVMKNIERRKGEADDSYETNTQAIFWAMLFFWFPLLLILTPAAIGDIFWDWVKSFTDTPEVGDG